MWPWATSIRSPMSEAADGSGTRAHRKSPISMTSNPILAMSWWSASTKSIQNATSPWARAAPVDGPHVGHRRFVTKTRQVDNTRDIADLDMNLDLMTQKDRTVVRLALTGSLTVTDRAALDSCLDKYSRLFAWLGQWERHTDLAVIPADGEFSDLGIGGFAAAAVDELVETAREGDNATAADAQAALALLLRLADRGAA